MIAKLIVWDEDRSAAIRRLHAALARCRIGGVVTNLNLLLAITDIMSSRLAPWTPVSSRASGMR